MLIAVAGTGFGQAVYLPAFTSLPHVQVVALASSRPDVARGIADKYVIPTIYSDLDAMLDHPGLDAVALALPPVLGAATVEKALARGLAVFTEKPLAPTLDQARRLQSLAQGRITAIDYTFTEVPAFALLRQILSENRYGAVRSVHISWHSLSYAQRHGKWGWKLDANRCGGIMSALGDHVLHMLEWLVGTISLDFVRFQSVTTAAMAPAGEQAAPDGVDMAFRFGSQGTGTLSLSSASPGCSHHRWEIICDGGTLVIYRDGPGVMSRFGVHLVDADGQSHCLLAPEPGPQGQDDRLPPFRSLAERFVASVRSGTPCQPDFAAGVRVQELVAMAYQMGSGD